MAMGAQMGCLCGQGLGLACMRLGLSAVEGPPLKASGAPEKLASKSSVQELKICGGCGLKRMDLVPSPLGWSHCRKCIRSADEEALGPLTSEEQSGLDAIASILDTAPLSYWKPGPQPAKILDWLYLGDFKEAVDLDLLSRNKIGAVLNLMHWWDLQALLPEDVSMPDIYSCAGVGYEEVDAEDRLRFDIVGSCWEAAEAFIARCRREGRRVLVHCKAGHNRSACLVVCWLMAHEGMTLLAAVEHAQRLRGTILSNHGFRLQLVRFALARGKMGDAEKFHGDEADGEDVCMSGAMGA